MCCKTSYGSDIGSRGGRAKRVAPDPGPLHTPRVQSGATTMFARGGYVQGGFLVPLRVGRLLCVQGPRQVNDCGRRPHKDPAWLVTMFFARELLPLGRATMSLKPEVCQVAQHDHRKTAGKYRTCHKSVEQPWREICEVCVDGPRSTGSSALRNVEDTSIGSWSFGCIVCASFVFGTRLCAARTS